MPKSLIHRLYQEKQIDCPRWLPDNLCYLTLMGSRAYSCGTPDSDYHYVGFCVPPRNTIFPQEYGLLLGFDNIPVFEQFKKDHFIEQSSQKDMEITIYGLVRYVKLLTDGNPNIIESIFTQRHEIQYSTPVAERLRENRGLLISCLESHYGSLAKVFTKPNAEKEALLKIKEIIDGI